MITATLIMTVIGLVLGIVDSAVSGTARSKMMKKAEKLANQLNKVDRVREQLVNAYNAKDYELANSILLASPFSGAYDTLMRERQRISKEYEAKKNQIDELSDKINKSRGEANAGSSASGFIDGTQAHLESNKIKDDYTNEIDKLVNGGVTNISQNTNSLGALKDPVKKV